MQHLEEQEYTKQFDFELWKNLFRYTKPYKKYLIRLIFIMVGVAGIDAIFPLMGKFAVDNFIVAGDMSKMGIYIAVFSILVVVQAFNVWMLITTAGKIEVGVCYDIRKNAFRRIQELSLSYFDRTPVGWMMARMTSDTQRLGQIIAWGSVDSIWGIAMMVIMMSIMLILNWKLALTALVVMPALIVTGIYFQKRILKAFRDIRKTNSKITASFNEGITGARTSKTLVREGRNIIEFNEITDKMYHKSVKAAIFSSLYMPIVLLLGSIGTGLVLWKGGNNVINGVMGYGTLVAFINYVLRFFEPVRELARIFADLQYAQASGERILSLIDKEPDIKDKKEIIQKFGDFFNPVKKDWPGVEGDILFENVSFRYKKGEEVLKNFNLHVKKGQNIALVGATGSGKSTIVNLVCRFYEPVEGRILIDGTDYRERSQLWLHSNLGYVLQTPHLFSGTIMENIKYGRLDAGDEDVIKASKLVNAHDFIVKLDKAYEAEVGEGGARLSMGQKQLVSFARAIIADPAIFVLDEATSSIDSETEQVIQSAVEKVLEGRTSFIIAHRLSTIRNADRILVIDKGTVIEEGTHQELLKLRGRYYNLYNNQFLDEQEIKTINMDTELSL